MSNHPFPWREAFLAALREIPVVQHACNACDIERSTAYRARDAHPDFAAAWKEAQEAGIDRAEAEAFRRGVVGFEEPVVYQGQLTPVWACDASGERLLEDYETGDYYPPKHEKAGEPIIGRRPVQARDSHGRPVWLTIRKHSDVMLGMILKGRRKQVYAERTEITGADGGPLTVDETTRRARLQALLAEARERKAQCAAPRNPEDYA